MINKNSELRMSLDFQYIEHNSLIIEESFYNLNEREFKLSHINKFLDLAPKINKKRKLLTIAKKNIHSIQIIFIHTCKVMIKNILMKKNTNMKI